MLLLALKGYYLGGKHTNNKQSDSFLIHSYSTSIEIKNIKVQMLTLLKKSIDDVDQLEESLNLSDEIRSFIVSVTNRKAKVSDVTDNIIRWIKEEHLENKFVINFKN